MVEMPRVELGPVNRTVAAVLAALWIGAGLAAALLGLARRRWLLLLLGPLAIAYGLVWVRVARTRRRLKWPARHP